MRANPRHKRVRKNESITFRVTAEKRDHLEDAAIAVGLNLSAFLDGLTDNNLAALNKRLKDYERLAAPPEAAHRPFSPEAKEQFARIGNNLNQIAHAINAGLPPHLRNTSLVLKAIFDLIIEHDVGPDDNAVRQIRDILCIVRDYGEAANDGSSRQSNDTSKETSSTQRQAFGEPRNSFWNRAEQGSLRAAESPPPLPTTPRYPSTPTIEPKSFGQSDPSHQTNNNESYYLPYHAAETPSTVEQFQTSVSLRNPRSQRRRRK